MPATYEPIASTTVSGTPTDIEFTSVAATWTDLCLVVSGLTSVDTAYVIRVNGDTGNNYSHTILYGTGSSTGSTRSSNINYIYGTYYADASSGTPTVSVAHFQSCANTNVYKSILVSAAGMGGSSNKGVDRIVGLWRSTSAITSIKISASSGTWAAGTTASLYGIKAA